MTAHTRTHETVSDESDRSNKNEAIEPRTRCAVTEYISILEDDPRVAGADDMYLAVSHSGESYVVDYRTGACECADAEYRNPEGGCKHVRRLAVIRGDRELPDAIDRDAIDPQLGEHVDVDVTDETPIATDGGIIEASDDGVVLDSTPDVDESEPETESEPDRPDDCECNEFHTETELPCWSCHREGFETVATEGSE